MPKYRITGPDGSKYEINAPEGATEAQVFDFFKQSQQQKQSSTPEQPPRIPMSGLGKEDQALAMQQQIVRESAPKQEAPGRFSRLGNALAEGFGNDQIGLSEDSRNALRNVGLMPSEKTYSWNVAPTLTGSAIETVAGLGDLALRGLNAGTRGLANIGQQGLEMVGLDEGPTGYNMGLAERDLYGMMTMPVSPIGLTRPSVQPIQKASKIAEQGNISSKAEKLNETLQAFEQEGIKPTIPALTDSRAVMSSAMLLRDVPVAGGVIDRSIKNTLNKFTEGQQKASGVDSNVSRDAAGGVIQRNIDTFIKQGSKDEIEDAYTPALAMLPQGKNTPLKVIKGIDDQTPPLVSLPNLRSQLKNLKLERLYSGFKDEPIKGDTGQALQNIMGDIQELGVNPTIGGLRGLRTRIGELTSIKAPPGETNLSQGQVKRLYGAITKDIYQAIEDAGGPEAVAAFRRADRQTQINKELVKRFSTFLGRTDNYYAKTEEKVFDDLLSKIQSGTSADRKGFGRIMKVLDEPTKNTVRASLIQRLGATKPGVAEDLSLTTFATNYRNFDRGSLDLLLPKGTPQRQALDRLATIAESYDKVAKLANHSGTSRGNVFYGLVGGAGLIKYPMATVGGFASSYALSKVLTSPKAAKLYVKTVETLAEANKELRKAGRQTPKATYYAKLYGSSVNKLASAMRQNEELKDYADEVEKSMQIELSKSDPQSENKNIPTLPKLGLQN